MKKAVLIVNPSSGGEKAKEFETLAEEKLKQLFDEVVVKQTEKAAMQNNLPVKLRKVTSTVFS